MPPIGQEDNFIGKKNEYLSSDNLSLGRRPPSAGKTKVSDEIYK